MRLRTLKKRRRQARTDYKLRFGLLKSNMPRIVIRKTNKYLIAQAVETIESQDKIIQGVTSRELLKNGWDKKYSGSLKNIPACYLTGMLLAKKLGDGEYIIDAGMAKNKSGGRIYAVIKGLIDGGLNVRANEKIFPVAERLNGEHLNPDVKKLMEKVKAKLGGKNA